VGEGGGQGALGQQRAILFMLQTFFQLPQGDAEIDPGAGPAHFVTVGGLEDRASSASDHGRWLVSYFANRLALPQAESGLALRGKNFRDGTLCAPKDDFIRIMKRNIKATGEEGAHGAFARAR